MILHLIAMSTMLALSGPVTPPDPQLLAEAKRIAQSVMIADTHIDVPYRLHHRPADVSVPTAGGDFDYPRAIAGGLNAVFMSIFTPARLEGSVASTATADTLIDLVQGIVVRAPEKFGLATSVDEMLDVARDGRIAFMLGMENGSPIAGDLSNLAHFFVRGVRYVTLAHAKDNHISDSSYDDRTTWGGLSPFGTKVVREMNRLGIIVDVSHITDDAFYQVLEVTKAPVIASHSSCRHFTPGFHRNMSDAMIRALADNGGVIHINFGSVFVSDDVRRRHERGREQARRWARENGFDLDHEAVRAFRRDYYEQHPRGSADVSDVADHIDHVVNLVGVDHVGLGSDFDGVGDTLPTGLEDVSAYPNLIYELLVRGYTTSDIEKICSGNLIRVWREVERIAADAGDRP